MHSIKHETRENIQRSRKQQQQLVLGNMRGMAKKAFKSVSTVIHLPVIYENHHIFKIVTDFDHLLSSDGMGKIPGGDT
jgi:hypothetical protein